MEHCGYVVVVKNIRPHPNADRLQIATFFGNDVCVGLDVMIGEIGVYFPSDLQLSEEFCRENDLVRRKTEDGKQAGGYLDPDKRNIKAIKLRGEKSDGMFVPLSAFTYTGVNMDDLNEGDTIQVLNGHPICNKYIPRTNHRTGRPTEGNRTRKKKVDIAPLFAEHADTEQLAYNLGAFKPGDEIEITLKMHGTSQRIGYLPTLKKYKKTFIDWLNRREGTPVYDWGHVSGTRRVVLDTFEGGFYGSNAFREQHAKAFEGKLHKGETVYFEVVGFTNDGTPIMSNGDNKKLGDDFVKQYGETTVFSYGCEPFGFKVNPADPKIPTTTPKVDYAIPQSDLYVYRMTMTNEDGFVVEYAPDFMRYRCEQMGVKTVPVLYHGILTEPDDWTGSEWNAGEMAKYFAEQFYDGPDPIGKTHIREGVVVRIINRPKFCAYKHKNYEFKMLEGLIKETADAPDMEEAQSLVEEEEV
jgi:hypothetical protein